MERTHRFNVILKLVKKIRLRKETGCWLWQGFIDNGRYGKVVFNAKSEWAHRVSFEVFYNRSVAGMVVCHKCDTPSCINPNHLFLGTQRDNIHDSIRKNRHTRGTRSHHAKIGVDEVRKIRALWKTGNFRQREIGAMFGLSQQHICKIVNEKKWRDLV